MAVQYAPRRRVGDLRESIDACLKAPNEDGVLTVEDITGLTITFTMVNMATGVTKVDAASATIDDATAGKVSYDFSAADVDTAGKFSAAFIITESGELSHFPAAVHEYIVLIDSDTTTGEAAYEAAVAAL